MAGLLTLFRVRMVAATSSTFESRPYCAAITSYPSACSGRITLLKHEPSAQIPWQNTMLGLVCGAIAPPFSGVATDNRSCSQAKQRGRAMTMKDR